MEKFLYQLRGTVSRTSVLMRHKVCGDEAWIKQNPVAGLNEYSGR